MPDALYTGSTPKMRVSAELHLPVVETTRLALAPLTAADATDLLQPLASTELYRFVRGKPPTYSELREQFQSWERRGPPDGREVWLNWTVRLRATREAIGYVQATVAEKSATIAYVTGVAWQRRGLTKEGVGAMVRVLRADFGVQTVVAHIPAGHLASERVACSAGLEPTEKRTDEGEVIWVQRLSS